MVNIFFDPDKYNSEMPFERITLTYYENRGTDFISDRFSFEIFDDKFNLLGQPEISVGQLGANDPDVAISAPMGVDFNALPASGGTFSAGVALTGDFEGWTAVAETSNPGNFLTVGAQTTGTPPTGQTIDYGVNTGVARTGQVTFTTSGGTGDPVFRTVEFRQLGAAPTLMVSETDLAALASIPAVPTGGRATGTITATLTLGGGAEGWRVMEGDDMDGLIESFTESGDRDNPTLTITYNANTAMARTATLTITTEGGTGTADTRDLVLTQLAGPPTIDVSTDAPDIAMIPADPGGVTGTITATLTLGGGATGWTATESVDMDGLIDSFTESGDRENPTLTITYNANTDATRTATLTITTTGGDGDATWDLVLTQLAGPPTLSVATVPADLDLSMIPASPTGTITATITLGGSATDWMAAKSGDLTNAFSFLPGSGDETNNRLTITYNANTGVEREVTINLTPTDADGNAGTVVPLTITQLGGPPTIDGISTDAPDNTMIPGTPGTITATITLGGGATGWRATKSADLTPAFIKDFTAMR